MTTPEDHPNEANEPTEQAWADAQARLSAADPAAGAPDPDIAAIRARVLEEGPPASENVVPMEPRRRHRGLLIGGSIAAGIVVLAGVALGGVALGRVTSPSGEIVAAPAETVEGLPVMGAASPQLPSVPGSAQPQGGGAAPAAMSTEDAKSMPYPGGGWGSVFEPAPDLPDEAGTASGYRLDGSGVDARALATRLAAAFGVKGKPTSMEGSWMVGPEDYSGPTIWVSEDGMVSWSYSDPTQNPWECAPGDSGVATPEPAPAEPEPRADMGAMTSSESGAVEGSEEGTAPESCDPEDEPMSEREALSKARDLLASVGVTDDEAAGIDIEWETGTDGYTTWVTAWQRVEGSRTQLSWSVTYGAKDPLWANGFAAGLVPVEDYPIVGAKTAVERSQLVRWMAFGPTPIDGGIVVPMEDAAAASEDVASPATPRASDPRTIEVWLSPITVTGAEPTLVQYWQPDGTMLLLPAYRLTTADDRGTWAVIAVADSAVNFVDGQ